MNKSLPDKWVRKAIFEAINNIVVDGQTIPCYDYRMTANGGKDFYILMTTQENREDKSNKCESHWQGSITLDIVTSYQGQGNPGSRLLADNILDRVISLTNNLTLDVESGLTIVWQRVESINDVSEVSPNENTFRKILRIALYIN